MIVIRISKYIIYLGGGKELAVRGAESNLISEIYKVFIALNIYYSIRFVKLFIS